MNVDKGSWKNRSVTWGKLLALRVGPRVSVPMLRLLWGAAAKAADPPGGPSVGWRTSLLVLFS